MLPQYGCIYLTLFTFVILHYQHVLHYCYVVVSYDKVTEPKK